MARTQKNQAETYQNTPHRGDYLSRHRIDASTHAYVQMMQGWMRGNFDWYNERRTERYTDYLTTAIPA